MIRETEYTERAVGYNTAVDVPTPTDSRSIDRELLEFLNGPPPQDENGIDLSIIRENLSLSMEERAERHYQARLFIERLNRSRGTNGPFPAIDQETE
ncbi:hypothetical protein [Humisphaera borealis]|uniref:Uncharacterized protein n=1 Tax=Humisphaera borealis TaxID=2807512 RepID=A0A7M2X302_9BACT|nr:hypothetical protein [Humisphaera borealis]QOV92138.1 hypothetical protein IPV69_12595 [Humisphaera borealis]